MGRLCAVTGRILVVLGGLALLGAWFTQLTGTSLFGMSQQHLFNDAMALALLGIAMLIDAHLHLKKI
ncbi:MAG: hypothetical protein Q8Q07_02905 [Dehalococcoidales bacterium]|nr:hypothetical protein [Dehalococcoidales bacterium]